MIKAAIASRSNEAMAAARSANQRFEVND